MMNINNFSSKIARYLASELRYDASKEAWLVFGLELLLEAVLKTVSILIIAYFFGIFEETLIIIVVSGSLRVVSGGEHCSAFHRCLIGGAIVFLLIGFTAKLLGPVISHRELVILFIASVFFIMGILLKYAPGDTANKPIIEDGEKKRYRKLSVLVAAVYLLAVFFLVYLKLFLDVAFLVIIGLLWQSFMITPFGYRFIRSVDRFLMIVTKGGRDHGPENFNRR